MLTIPLYRATAQYCPSLVHEHDIARELSLAFDMPFWSACHSAVINTCSRSFTDYQSWQNTNTSALGKCGPLSTTPNGGLSHITVVYTVYSVLYGVTTKADAGMTVSGQCWSQVISAHCTSPLMYVYVWVMCCSCYCSTCKSVGRAWGCMFTVRSLSVSFF